MISAERITELTLLVRNGSEGDAEKDATNKEEKDFVAHLRESVKPLPGMVLYAPSDPSFSIHDSPDFDFYAWVEAGMPEDNARFLRPYKPKPYGWMPSLKGNKSEM
jgi:hypothetical protein